MLPLVTPLTGVASTPVASCEYTLYDGVDDAYVSTDVKFKISTAQTWAYEFYHTTVASYQGLLSQYNNSNGMSSQIQLNNAVYTYANTGNSNTTLSGLADTWVTWVMVYNGSNLVSIYKNGVASGTISVTLTAATNDFNIARMSSALGRYFNGRMRNVYVASGATSTPTAYDPEDPDGSLTDTTRIMYSPNGSGEDNSESITFTKLGAPTQVAC